MLTLHQAIASTVAKQPGRRTVRGDRFQFHAGLPGAGTGLGIHSQSHAGGRTVLEILQDQADQQLAAKRGQLEMARQQSKEPAVVQQLIKQAEASGQVPAAASDAQKAQAARSFIDRQLQQMEDQFKQAEQSSKVAINQRRFGGSGGAIALIVAFTILCLGSIL